MKKAAIYTRVSTHHQIDKESLDFQKKELTRKDLANQFSNVPYQERLEKAKAIDLKNNHTIKDLGNDYCEIIPNDESKLVENK
ncbi:hypothetical protein MWH25_01160 [Natroniella acetigena]|uniref:hypothetical protein n=1 Tax=Natroniella acetigena TaxID=52004 RepID=UPI00200A1905|nr:hypothetical protein [Natroniella acetigena]MCK8826355.1 hypothetical protein [Natroniella acetigena]